ncbi:MAG: ligase-associated DNA damage response exonuclease [Hyphomicrobiaceae bacterium]|nr:ligase-associated DNA damage response exonuclease [Hyphomicrobiaceae bacterium]
MQPHDLPGRLTTIITTEPFESWLRPDAAGLHCVPGGFHIDPARPVERAIVTHGHSDHARAGNAAVLATPETLAVMRVRLGAGAGGTLDELAYGRPLRIGDVTVTLRPAGHILGSAQVVIDYRGRRAVVTGDYKRRHDPTCAPFELVPCDLLVTEATFGLPVFRHEPDAREIGKLLASLAAFPERTHQVGVYGLGKCQRLIVLLRQAGYGRTIWLHGALVEMCALYVRLGVSLGDVRPVASATTSLAGEIVLSPPSALGDRWSRRLADPVTAFASGWMRVRGRARQRSVELPLVISDHVDWPELMATIEETAAGEIWVTHGREEAVVYAARRMGRRARALALVGREDETE